MAAIIAAVTVNVSRMPNDQRTDDGRRQTDDGRRKTEDDRPQTTENERPTTYEERRPDEAKVMESRPEWTSSASVVRLPSSVAFPWRTILTELAQVDVANLTPVQALNWLNEMQLRVRQLLSEG